MKSSSDSPCPGRLTRRTATVTISAPEASMASRMFSNEGYFPVPTMRRDLNSLPPSHSDVSYMSAPSHGTDDLHAVALREHGVGVARLEADLPVEGHRGVLAADLELAEQTLDGEPFGQLHRLPVHSDGHRAPESKKPHLDRVRSRLITLAPRSLRWDYPDQVRGVPGRTRFSGNLPPRRASDYTPPSSGGARAPASVCVPCRTYFRQT